MMSGELLAVYIFGSVGRGDNDASSDLDILAVVRDGEGRVSEAKVEQYIPRRLAYLKPEISWYGVKRLSEMFSKGELFAWHIFQDSLALYDPSDLIQALGEPRPYTAALEDIRSFSFVLSGVPEHAMKAPWNLPYEAGLIYICARNIAMSGTAVLLGEADFSRNSPFVLSAIVRFPLSPAEYQKAMNCRLSGQRGFGVPSISGVEEVLEMQKSVKIWSDEVAFLVEKEISK